ncbi:MAG: DUF3048 C-terminal domain-containing protein, partial [Gemmiger sp.]
MKLLQAAAVTAALLFALTACSVPFQESEPTPTPSPTAEPTPSPSPTPAPADDPLTGIAGSFAERRPVAVSLRTEAGSGPLWGISRAGVVVEGVAQGYTASLMALFTTPEDAAKVGPVGPCSDLLLQVALPLNAIPVHIGKSVYASNLLNVLAYQDLDGLHVGKAAFAFDLDRSAGGYREENCWYTTPELIRAGLDQYGLSTEGVNAPLFRFGERPAVGEGQRNATELVLTFSSSDSERFTYQADQGVYTKTDAEGGQLVDADNGEAVTFTNVFVLYASSGIKDDGVTRQYDLSGGTGIYLNQGAWQTIHWSKGDATAPLSLTDADGQPLTVSAGRSFIGIWGGYYGQALQVLAADGTEQTLPAKPALLESGVPDDVAAAAEAEYETYLATQVAAQELELLRSQLETAQKDLEAAQAAVAENDNEATQADLVLAQAIVDQLTAKIEERQALLDAATQAAQEQPAP